MHKRFRLIAFVPIALSVGALLVVQAFATDTTSGWQDQFGIGAPGKAADARRSVAVVMQDNYFEPERIEILTGETVRFRIRNDGDLVHEFHIGTPEMQLERQAILQMMADHGVIQGGRIDRKMMKMDMGGGHTMEFKDPNAVLLEPGQSAEIVWTFPQPTTIEFACTVPGHYEAGMSGGFAFVSSLEGG